MPARGPLIIVVHHPKTGERLYLETQVLPGAPRVVYTAHTIESDYGSQSMTFKFGHCERPSIVYHQGTSLVTRFKGASERRHEYTEKTFRRTGIPAACAKIQAGAKNVDETTADRVRDAGRIAGTPVAQIVRRTPLRSAFRTSPERRAMRERDDLVRQAEAESIWLEADIPTNRWVESWRPLIWIPSYELVSRTVLGEEIRAVLRPGATEAGIQAIANRLLDLATCPSTRRIRARSTATGRAFSTPAPAIKYIS